MLPEALVGVLLGGAVLLYPLALWEIIYVLLAYVLTWSALELTIGLHLRSCARRLTRTEA